GCGVLSQSTSGPPRVTTWSNSGKPGRERIHLRRRYRGWIGTVGKLGAGLAAPASVAPARLAVSASRPERDRLNLWRPPPPPPPAATWEKAPVGVVLPL